LRDAIYVGVKDARRHVMQQGFPDVDQAGIDQGDIGRAPADLVSQARNQLETAGATPHNYYLMSCCHDEAQRPA
jgi:hypothetical protein